MRRKCAEHFAALSQPNVANVGKQNNQELAQKKNWTKGQDFQVGQV